MNKKIKTLMLLMQLINEMFKNSFKLNNDINNNYKICQKISNKIISLSNITLNIKGKENIKNQSPILITPNHRSFFDIFILLSSIDETISFAAAKELYSYPLLNRYIKSINCISIDRSTQDITTIKQQINNICNHLKENNLILFPEGECNYFNDEVKKFKKGGFININKTNAKIVPTYINVSEIKKIGRWVIPTGNVSVTFGEAFNPNCVENRKLKGNELANYTREKVLYLKKLN